MRRTCVYLIGLLLVLPCAAAPRIAAGGIADAPFVQAVAAVVAGEALYVAGYDQEGDAGLAIYARDAAQGPPSFVGALTHRELGLQRVVALAASADGRQLYLLGADHQRTLAVGVFERLPGFPLARTEIFLLPGLGEDVPRSLAISPDGRHLYAGTDRRLATLALDAASGRPSLVGTSEGAPFEKMLVSRGGDSLYVAGGEVLALRSFRRDPATGELAPASSFHRFTSGEVVVNAAWDVAESPDGGYLYLLAADTDATHQDGVVVFESTAGGQLQQLGRGPGWTEESPTTLRLAVNPRNGTVYLATHDHVGASRLTAFPPLAGGRELGGAADTAADLPGGKYPIALAAGAEGDAVYLGGFDGLPIAAFETAGEAGALKPAAAPPPAVSGLAEMRDFAVSPAGSLVLAAGSGGRIGRVAWHGDAARFLGSQRLAEGLAEGLDVERIVFLDERRFAVLFGQPSGRRLLQLFELAADGAAAARGTRFDAGTSGDFWKSPDGRQLFLADRGSFRRFEYRAAQGVLVDHGPVGELGGYGPVRFSADGRSVLAVANQPAQVIPLYRTLRFRFDPQSGVLTAEPEHQDLAAAALDYAFSPDGAHLYVLKNGPDLDDLRVQVWRRGPNGDFGVVVQQHVLTSAATRIDSPAQMVLDGTGRRLAILGTADGALYHFDRDPGDGTLALNESQTGALTLPGTGFSEHPGKIAFGPAGSRFWLLDRGASRLAASRWGCGAPGELCLGEGGRFQVEADWSTADGGGAAQPVVAPSADSGLFYFFDPNNWEMLVKVLDGCAINGHYWFFAAATTDVGYTLRVSDTLSGQAKVYRNPLGTASPAITDTEALACPGPPSQAPAERRAPAAAAGDSEALVLRDRFELRVDWKTVAGAEGPARVVPFGAADSGLFYFFSDNNWEMLVKVLDGCAINGHFWVLAAATTDVGFTLEVKDRLAGGGGKLYTHAAGHAAPAILDLQALGGCPAAAEGER